MLVDEEHEDVWAVLSHTAGLFLLSQSTCAGFDPFNGLGQQPEMAFSLAGLTMHVLLSIN